MSVSDIRDVRNVWGIAKCFVLSLWSVKIEFARVGCPEAVVKTHPKVSLPVVGQLRIRDKASDVVWISFWIENEIVGCLVVLLIFACLRQSYICCLKFIYRRLHLVSQRSECCVCFSLTWAHLTFSDFNRCLFHFSFDNFAIWWLPSNLGRGVDLALIHCLSFDFTDLRLQTQNKRCFSHAFL